MSVRRPQRTRQSLDTSRVPHKAVPAVTFDPIVTIDSRGVIQSVSDSIQRVFGWTPSEIIGKNVDILVPDLPQVDLDGYLASYRESTRIENLNRAWRFAAVRKDGTFFPILVSVSSADIPGQAASLYVGIIRDLSDRHTESGADVTTNGVVNHADGNMRLYQQLAEQTAELEAAHLRLRMADRMASIGALAAGLGHDMNNVLLPVRAHLNAARGLTMVPEVRAHVEAVLSSVTYLQQLADGLHFLAQDADDQHSVPAATDIVVWWSHVGQLLTKAVPRHVKVSVSLPAGLPEVGISTHGLTQALLNLIVNAGQAIPTGRNSPQGLVRVWAQTAESGTHVKLGVTDNGVGMSTDVQRNAFEMFYTTKTRGLGTGLGLPLVARVVARVGGTVQIESQSDVGTTVTILLPAAGQHVQQPDTLRAAITLSDGRAATFIRHLLEMAGVLVTPENDANSADIWVLKPMKRDLDAAKAWRKEHPRGGLVLFGQPKSSLSAWESLDPTVIKKCDDLDAIRSALSRAISGL